MSSSVPGSTSTLPIKLEDVAIQFGNNPPVLDGVNIEIPSGQTLVLFGESGSGKSTILSLILGLLHPNRGRVCVFDQEVSYQTEQTLYPIRQTIGMVFQHSALFDSQTVAENVGFRLLQQPEIEYAAVEAEVKQKLAFVGLAGFEDRYPGQLSGGQKKRVAIARALVGSPPILLYDEPTTGLDPITAKKILEVIVRIKNELGTTSIVVTHELHYAYSIAQRVLLLRQGKIVFDGASTMFKESNDNYIREFRSMEAM